MLMPAKNQSKITKLYKKAGMKPPIGKGEHTMAFHKLVTSIGTKVKNPYAVAMAQLGAKRAVQKKHQKLTRHKNK